MLAISVTLGLVHHRVLNKFLIIHRADRIPPIAFPGGSIEIDETEEQAVKREVMEETSIDCLPLFRLGERIHPATQMGMSYWYCDHRHGIPNVCEPEKDKIKGAEYMAAELILSRTGNTLFPAIKVLLQASIR